MSQENAELIERIWRELIEGGDPTRIPMELVDPAVRYEDDILPDHAGETYEGHEGLQRAWTRAIETFDMGDFENRIEWTRWNDDYVVTSHHVRARGEGSGLELEFNYAYVWVVRDGLLVYCKSCRSAADALAVAGLSE